MLTPDDRRPVTRRPTYVAFEVSRGTGYVGQLGEDGAYHHLVTCNDLESARELASALNDREDLRDADA